MSYYQVSERVLDLTIYATKKIEHDAGVDFSDLAVKKDFIALKAEDEKIDINKLVNVPTKLNNLNTNVDECSDRFEKIK